jgi:hypothetical protein
VKSAKRCLSRFVKFFPITTLLSVTFSPSVLAGPKEAAANAVYECIHAGIVRLDDRVSSADVIARATVSSCEKTISNYLNQMPPPRFSSRMDLEEYFQKKLTEETVVHVLASRTKASDRKRGDE